MPDPLPSLVQALIAQALQVPPDQVTPEAGLGSLPQWDSMGHMEIMLQLEMQFGVEINADTIAQLTSFPAICERLAGSS